MHGLLEDTERKQIVAALGQANWVVAGPKGAEAQVGMRRSTLQCACRGLAFEFLGPRTKCRKLGSYRPVGTSTSSLLLLVGPFS